MAEHNRNEIEEKNDKQRSNKALQRIQQGILSVPKKEIQKSVSLPHQCRNDGRLDFLC